MSKESMGHMKANTVANRLTNVVGVSAEAAKSATIGCEEGSRGRITIKIPPLVYQQQKQRLTKSARGPSASIIRGETGRKARDKECKSSARR